MAGPQVPQFSRFFHSMKCLDVGQGSGCISTDSRTMIGDVVTRVSVLQKNSSKSTCNFLRTDIDFACHEVALRVIREDFNCSKWIKWCLYY